MPIAQLMRQSSQCAIVPQVSGRLSPKAADFTSGCEWRSLNRKCEFSASVEEVEMAVIKPDSIHVVLKREVLSFLERRVR